MSGRAPHHPAISDAGETLPAATSPDGSPPSARRWAALGVYMALAPVSRAAERFHAGRPWRVGLPLAGFTALAGAES